MWNKNYETKILQTAEAEFAPKEKIFEVFQKALKIIPEKIRKTENIFAKIGFLK